VRRLRLAVTGMNQPQMNTDKHGFFLMVGRVTPCAPFGYNQRLGGQGTPMNSDKSRADREQVARPTRQSMFYPCPSAYSGVAATRLYAVSIRG